MGHSAPDNNQRTCAWCGGPNTRPRSIYCSKSHQTAAWQAKTGKKPVHRPGYREDYINNGPRARCKYCNCDMPARRSDMKPRTFCTKRCANIYNHIQASHEMSVIAPETPEIPMYEPSERVVIDLHAASEPDVDDEVKILRTNIYCRPRRFYLPLFKCLDDFVWANLPKKHYSACFQCPHGKLMRESYADGSDEPWKDAGVLTKGVLLPESAEDTDGPRAIEDIGERERKRLREDEIIELLIEGTPYEREGIDECNLPSRRLWPYFRVSVRR